MPREGWLDRAFQNVDSTMAELPDWVWASPQALPPKPSYSDDSHPNRRKNDEPARESHLSQD